MRTTLATIGLAAAIAATALPARADSPTFRRTFDTTLPASGASMLAITGLNGDVRLTADAGSTVRIHAVLRAQSEAALAGTSVRTARSGSNVSVESVCNSRTQLFIWHFADCGINYEILYPKNLTVNVRNDNGDIHVEGAGAAVKIVNANGDVSAQNVAAALDLATKHGDVRASLADGWRGTAIALRTSMGDVHLEVPANFSASLQARTRLGDVTNSAHLHGGPITVVASTTLGDVFITRLH